MYALYDEQRRHLMRLSLMLVCGGLAVLPLTVPPASIAAGASQTAPRHARISVPDLPGHLTFPAIAVQRDPFAADAAALPVPAAGSHPAFEVRQGDDIGVVLPANAGAQDQPPLLGGSDAGSALVRGIVLGEEPQALIDTGSGVKVFGVGDRIGPDAIRAIDATGVTLSSGVRLRIASPTP
jgi:hypothetical protein